MDIGDINMDEWEIVPEQIPENETVRQYILRLTGRDLAFLDMHTWDEVRTFPPLREYLTDLVMRSGKPSRLLLRKKEVHGEH